MGPIADILDRYTLAQIVDTMKSNTVNAPAPEGGKRPRSSYAKDIGMVPVNVLAVATAVSTMFFDALVCADDVSVTKPDPEPYLLAAKLLGADPAKRVEVVARRGQALEGMAKDDALHPLQQGFLEHAALQCGICTPGMLMAAARLNLPSVFLYGGSILPGSLDGKDLTVQDVRTGLTTGTCGRLHAR